MSSTAKTMHDNYDELIAKSLRENFDWDGVSIFDRTEPLVVIDEALGDTKRQQHHVLQSSHPYFAQDLNVSARMLQKPEALATQPLTTILMPETEASHEKQLLVYEARFKEARQKSEILSGVDSSLSKRGISDSIRGDVVLIADELFTNAVYNAPFVDLDNTGAGLARDADNIKMPSDKWGHLSLGVGSQQIVIGCKDNCGTLNLERLLARVKNCYEQGVAATMRMSGRSGAGIGSFMIFNSAASIFYDVKAHAHTAVYCTLPLKMSSRARMEIPKQLHFRNEK